VRPGGAVELLFSGLDAPAEPRLSPDGTRIVLASNNSTQLLTYDFSARSMIRTAGDPSSLSGFGRPEWTPDGERQWQDGAAAP